MGLMDGKKTGSESTTRRNERMKCNEAKRRKLAGEKNLRKLRWKKWGKGGLCERERAREVQVSF